MEQGTIIAIIWAVISPWFSKRIYYSTAMMLKAYYIFLFVSIYNQCWPSQHNNLPHFHQHILAYEQSSEVNIVWENSRTSVVIVGKKVWNKLRTYRLVHIKLVWGESYYEDVRLQCDSTNTME